MSTTSFTRGTRVMFHVDGVVTEGVVTGTNKAGTVVFIQRINSYDDPDGLPYARDPGKVTPIETGDPFAGLPS